MGQIFPPALHTLSPLGVVKLGVVLLGLFNLALTLSAGRSASSSARLSGPDSERALRIKVKDHPELALLHLDVRPPDDDERRVRPRTRTLFTEETVHYPVSGERADQEWASLVPEANHGLVLVVDPFEGENQEEDQDQDHEEEGQRQRQHDDHRRSRRPYAVSMFHTLHCLDRIRRAIVATPGTNQARRHVQHCFNYVRQMILCAADTRLNPTNHVQPSSGLPASDGIGLEYVCRDWDAVYAAFEANYALTNWTSVDDWFSARASLSSGI